MNFVSLTYNQWARLVAKLEFDPEGVTDDELRQIHWLREVLLSCFGVVVG